MRGSVKLLHHGRIIPFIIYFIFDYLCHNVTLLISWTLSYCSYSYHIVSVSNFHDTAYILHVGHQQLIADRCSSWVGMTLKIVRRLSTAEWQVKCESVEKVQSEGWSEGTRTKCQAQGGISVMVSVWKSGYKTRKKTVTGPDRNPSRPQMALTNKDRRPLSG